MSEQSQHVKGYRDRVEAWHRLMDEAFVRLWWSDDETVTVEFDIAAGPHVRERLLELVRTERQCSGFLGWRVRRTGTHLRLQVKGPGAADTVAALAYSL